MLISLVTAFAEQLKEVPEREGCGSGDGAGKEKSRSLQDMETGEEIRET